MESIIIENQSYAYKLIKEKRKTLTLSFKEGVMVVKAPNFISYKEIEKFILSHQKDVITFFEHYTPYYSIDDHYVYLFNKKYQLRFIDLSKNKCVLHDDTLYVYGRNIEKTLDSYFKETLYDYCKLKIDYYLSHDFDLPFPAIQIKKYTGRWGSCYYRENRVSFNKTLIHLDPKLIDYVIVHELCHFIESNHSSLFYKEIEKRMPDYKERIKRLKEIHI